MVKFEKGVLLIRGGYRYHLWEVGTGNRYGVFSDLAEAIGTAFKITLEKQIDLSVAGFSPSRVGWTELIVCPKVILLLPRGRQKKLVPIPRSKIRTVSLAPWTGRYF